MKENKLIFNIIISLIFLIFFSGSFFIIENIYKNFDLNNFFNLLIETISGALWIILFSILTILPLSIFFSLFIYLYYIFPNKYEGKNIFCIFLKITSAIPEVLWLIIFLIIFNDQKKDSILFFALLMFFPIFIYNSNYLLSILKYRSNKIRVILENEKNFLELIFFNIIPLISKDLILLIFKISIKILSFSIIFLAVNDIYLLNNEDFKIAKSISENGETFLSQIYILFFKIANINNENEKNRLISLISIIILAIFLIKLIILTLYKRLQNKDQ